MSSNERHVSWLELFFDLVVVAAIAQLAHQLHKTQSLTGIGVFAALYLAVWLAWASITIYGNVARDDTRQRIMLAAMLGIAAMAATIPQATGQRVLVFTCAYIFVRTLALSTWVFNRQSLFVWPALVGAAAVLPWIVSLIVASPGRYLLWGLGMGIDILAPVFVARKTTGPHAGSTRIDLSHLAERLGLLMIIVLGEAVMQLVAAAASATWTPALLSVIVAGFLLLIGLWSPMFRYGFVATGGRGIEVKAIMPLHFANTISITAMAAGLGILAAHPTGHVPDTAPWLIYGGGSIYFLAALIGGLVTDRTLRQGRSSWWLVPCVLIPAALAVTGGHLPGALLPWPMVAIVLWQAWYSSCPSMTS